jgi:hypothetical protein
MKTFARITILTLLFVAAYAVAQEQPKKEQPTVAQLQLTIAQQQVTIEQQKKQMLQLQQLLLQEYMHDSDVSAADAQAKLKAAEEAIKEPVKK